MIAVIRTKKICFRHWAVWLSLVCLAVTPALSLSGPTIPGFYGSNSSRQVDVPSLNTLPVLDQVVQGADLEKVADNKLDIHQNQDKAIINWRSFDIGANAWTHFDQQGNTDWAALNRIYDENPSQIYGRLTADGRVFLVNQNGILFGPGSQVNVHSLVGSALNTSDEDFMAGTLSYRLQNYNGQDYGNPDDLPEDSCVANHGTIETGQGGGVFLMAPQVENSGVISSPFGQVGLAAGTHVALENEQDYNTTSQRVARLVNVKEGAGTAQNLESGQVIADMGTAGMYGQIVNQNGMIRSVTAVQKDGNIELIASNKVSLGPGSYTGCPVNDSTEEVHESFPFAGGEIQIHSHDPEEPTSYRVLPADRIEIYGTVEAPSGLVNMAASERIYMESGSRMDVGGSIVNNPASDNIIDAQLNSVEMRDDYGQKGGVLQGENITFSAQEGSSVGDVSGHLVSEEKTAGEFSTKGGDIYLTCNSGDIIIKEDADIDFSGGGIYYTSGSIETTKLVSGHQVYDISDAPQWIEYDRIMGSFRKTYNRFGMEDAYEGVHYGGPNAFKELAGGYFQGDDAGSLWLVAPQIVLDGDLNGSALAGVFQTEISEQTDENGNRITSGTTMPVGGTLVIGTRVEGNEWTSLGQNKVVAEIVVKDTVAPRTDVTADTEIPMSLSEPDTLQYAGGEYVPKTLIGADKLNAAGLDILELNANTRLTIEPEATLSLPAGGSFLAWARQFRIDGKISIPSGSVVLKANESYTATKELYFDPNQYDGIPGELTENPNYVDMTGGILLGGNSCITVSGERIDNTFAERYPDVYLKEGRLGGGTIHLIDQTDANFADGTLGLLIPEGAKLDVSGGYQMDPGGELTGGGAGEIKLVAADMALEGDLSGHSLQGDDGGTVMLLAKKLNIIPENEPLNAEEPLEKMILRDNRFSESGFTHLYFQSYEDLTVADGVRLSPSMVKRVNPEQSENSVAPVAANGSAETMGMGYTPDRLIEIAPEYLGDSSIYLSAAMDFEDVFIGAAPPVYSRIDVNPDAEIRVAPAGTIGMNATGIQMAGSLVAPAGSISLETDGQDLFTLLVTDTGRILAPGFNLPDETSLMDGLSVPYTPLDGGQVSLTASNGDTVIQKGAVIDVSGSDPVTQWFTDSKGGLDSRLIAGNPGSINFSFRSSLDVQSGASLRAVPKISGIQGGSLIIRKTDETEALIIASADTEIPATNENPVEVPAEESSEEASGEDVAVYPTFIKLEEILTSESGFDDISLASDHSIKFQGDQKLETGRKITLDTPLMYTEDDAKVQLTSNHVTLQNTDYPNDGTLLEESLSTGKSAFTVTADWIDLIGNVKFSGFGEEDSTGVSLTAENDMRLSDLFYTNDTGGLGMNDWSGGLTAPGGMELTAARIYPATQGEFVFQSGGTITTHGSGATPAGPVYSAGGKITLLADRINHQGVLLAPMGQIVMGKSMNTELVDGETVITYEPAERIYLAPDSRISTQGETSVHYGAFDEEGIDWFYTDKSAGDQYAETPVTGGPDNQVQLVGDEVILRPGSEIDASGGGELFGYLFLPGIEGTNNPLHQTGQYVILPDNRIQLPGSSVYLEGTEGLPAGNYTLLPEEYAFMPDAIIIRENGINLSQEQNRLSSEQYPIITGYMTISGTDIRSPVVQDFIIRPAADVLAEGNFTTESLICGDAGDITIQGNTTIINGSITGNVLPEDAATGYTGGESGILSLAGKQVRIGEGAGQSDIGFFDPVGEDFENILFVSSDTLSRGNLGEICLGSESLTESIAIAEGSSVIAGNVTLTALGEISLNDGVEIHATGEQGVAQLTAGDRIIINGSAGVHATDHVIIDTNELNLGGGSLIMDNSALTLKSDAIYLAEDGAEADGLLMTPAMWNQISGAADIKLYSRSDIFFKGEVTVTADQTLSLEAARFIGLDSSEVNLSADTVTLSGSDLAASAGGVENSGTMSIEAPLRLMIQNGEIRFEGFSDIRLETGGEITFSGEGSLLTGGGDLTLNAGKISTAGYRPETETDEGEAEASGVPVPDFLADVPADFRVDACGGSIIIAPIQTDEAQETPDESESSASGRSDAAEEILSDTQEVEMGVSAPGGKLAFSGDAVEIGIPVDLPAGHLTCTSTGSGITIAEGAHIVASGTDAAPGGIVIFSAENEGNIHVAEGSLIDVAAGSQGDGGMVGLSAPGGSVEVYGDLVATASGGRGGEVSLDSKQIPVLSAITDRLTGFDRSMIFRSREGDVTVDADITVDSFKLTAENGDIILASTISATGESQGGWVELNAGNNLTLSSGSRIDAGGTGSESDGGTVFLNAAEGDLQFQEGARIIVSGNGDGRDGSVVLRATRDGSDDVRMHLDGMITGASEILAEAVAVRKDVTSINNSFLSGLRSETQSYMNAVAAGTTVDDLLGGLTVQDRDGTVLAGEDAAERFHLIPGIEIRSPEDGNLSLDTAWNLTSSWRFNGEAGALTLRSAGDLSIESDLNDSPTSSVNLPGDPGTDSWGIRLVSGADLTSADLMALNFGGGTLSVEKEKKVYTESGQLWFASGGNTEVGAPKNTGTSTQPLNMGTYDGDIRGIVGGDLNLESGIIQSATGDIRITIDGDLNITSTGSGAGMILGAVRTTGRKPDADSYPDEYASYVSKMYWDFFDGGNIDLEVAGNVNGEIDLDAWDSAYAWFGENDTVIYVWAANYKGNSATQGIATMGGGDLAIRCGGNFLGQAGTFGEGDLSIYSGGNMDGRFLISDGIGRLNTMGSLGTLPNLPNQTIEIMDAQVWVNARGHISLGSVINPTVAGTALNQNLYKTSWDMTYSYEGQDAGAENSAVHLMAHTGDVALTGQSAYGINEKDVASQAPYKLLPPVVTIEAAGDIFLQNNFVLAPSPTGNLSLDAGNNIYGQYPVGDRVQKSWIYMPDLDPDLVYGYQEPGYNNVKEQMITELLSVRNYANSPEQPLHRNDSTPISIQAGGDIQNLKLFLSKKAEISAGNDILDLYYEGQNIRPEDVTSITAGNRIYYTSEAFTITDTYKGIKHGGPGLLWVSAQNEIDLGTTEGIQTIGNLLNPILPGQGSHIIAIVGYDMDKQEAELREFFNAIQKSGEDYSNKLAEGDPEAAEQMVQTLRDTVIDPFFETADGAGDLTAQGPEGERISMEEGIDGTGGDLNMVRSQISSTGENSDIFVISRENLNVGLTTLSQDDADVENSGIFTAGGGGIFAFARGDLNVNESRIMTFFGGDITAWSDAGNINAGRGSKTAVSAAPAAATKNEAGEYEVAFKPPAVGSGIRTLTFDPDGAAGPEEPPSAGDVYLFAPRGEIDAGEAGISGKKVILGAVSVVNVQNISFSQGAVGVPSNAEATATMGALAGGGALSEAGKMADTVNAIDAANKQFEEDAKAMEKAFMPTWLKVEFMGFDVEDRESSEEDEN